MSKLKFSGRVRLVIALLSLVSSVGCGSASVGKFDSIFAGSDERSVMLSQRLDKFHRAVYWGSVNEVTEYVMPDKQLTFISDLKKQRKEQQFVDFEVSQVDFTDPEKNNADVEVKVRFFKVPTYVVETRREIQHWEFDRFDGGWKLRDVEPAADDADTARS